MRSRTTHVMGCLLPVFSLPCPSVLELGSARTDDGQQRLMPPVYGGKFVVITVSACVFLAIYLLLMFESCNELAELLRKSSEHTLVDMVQLLFSRLSQFQEDPKWATSARKVCRFFGVRCFAYVTSISSSVQTSLLRNQGNDFNVISCRVSKITNLSINHCNF